MARSRKRPAQARTAEEADATTVKANVKDVAAFQDYYSKNHPCNSYKDVRDYLNMLKFGVAHGMINSKAANTQVYIISHIMIAIKGMEKTDEDIEELQSIMEQTGGNISLTEEQAMLLTKQSSMSVQVSLLKKFITDNGQKFAPSDVVVLEKPLDVETVVEMADKGTEEEEGFV